MIDTISECSDQNVQLRRLTRVFARRTGHIGRPRDYRSQMRLVKALISLLMCRLIRLIVPVFVGLVMHTHMRIFGANLVGKISTDDIFLIFPRKQIWHCMQIVYIARNDISSFPIFREIVKKKQKK